MRGPHWLKALWLVVIAEDTNPHIRPGPEGFTGGGLDMLPGATERARGRVSVRPGTGIATPYLGAARARPGTVGDPL